MDAQNRFHTPGTWFLVRAEWAAFLAAAAALALAHARDMRWGRFALAFALIDLVGYLPGAVASRAAAGRPISPVYHHLYNVTHSFLTAAAVVALWALAAGGLEWAMLAIPIHLAGDRGLFGNTYKPVDLPFVVMGTLGGSPYPPAMGSRGQSPRAPTRPHAGAREAQS